MEPADEELQQLTAPPARAPNTRRARLVACVALASTALLFAATNTTKTKVSPAVLAAREIVKQQIAARDPAPGAGPHGPGDADTAHDVDSVHRTPASPARTLVAIRASRRSSSTSWSTTRRRRPTAESFLRTRGQYGAAHQEDPYNVRNMVSAVVEQYDDLFETCLTSDPAVDGSDTCSHYYVNSCDLDQSSRDSQVSCVEACVTDRFAQTMKGVIDDVSVCAYPVSSTFLLAPNVVKSGMDPTYDASGRGLYDTDSDCYEHLPWLHGGAGGGVDGGSSTANKFGISLDIARRCVDGATSPRRDRRAPRAGGRVRRDGRRERRRGGTRSDRATWRSASGRPSRRRFWK